MKKLSLRLALAKKKFGLLTRFVFCGILMTLVQSGLGLPALENDAPAAGLTRAI